MEPPTNISYREYHESYLSNLRGSHSLEVPLLLVAIVEIGFLALCLRCTSGLYERRSLRFFQDFVVFVLPSVLLITVLNDYVLHSLVLFSGVSAAVVVYELLRPSSIWTLSEVFERRLFARRRPFMTNFKAVVSLLTIICILAVDFRIFPLKYAKTESYGYSLMDTGVGFYVVSNGLTMKFNRTKPSLKKSFFSSLPIWVLGVIRFATLEGLDYQKHVTEYGTHWNFFFSLAGVKMIGPQLAGKRQWRCALAAVTLIVLHQLGLWWGLERWVMSETPRTDWLSANREGLVSLPGYLSLYLWAALLGSLILLPPGWTTLTDGVRQGAVCLVASAALFVGASAVEPTFPASRRLANPTFALWMFAICLLVLGISLFLESMSVAFCLRSHVSVHRDESTFILEAISANNLLFFLLCNLLTGTVNLCMRTLLVPPLHSLIVLTTYVFISCGIISWVYCRDWKLKVW